MSFPEILRKKPLGILCAMPEEVAEYRRHLNLQEPLKVAGVDFFEGTLGKCRVVVAQCGVGKVHAAAATQTLLLKFDVGGILFSGVAGALHPDLDVGDLVISKDAIQHDMDLEPLGFEPGQVPWTPWRAFECAEDWVRWAEESAKELGHRTMVGRVVSGDQFVADPERVKVLIEDFKGDAVEMEAGAVGQVCALNGDVPWITIRAISDKADHSSPVDFPAFCQDAAVKSYELVRKMCSLEL